MQKSVMTKILKCVAFCLACGSALHQSEATACVASEEKVQKETKVSEPEAPVAAEASAEHTAQ